MKRNVRHIFFLKFETTPVKEEKMERDAILEDIKGAFTDFLTQKAICQKKRDDGNVGGCVFQGCCRKMLG